MNCKLAQNAVLPLEPIILLLAGMTMLLAGILLFPVAWGTLPYYENGLYGLLLIIFALQTIALGKTPFGDIRKSKLFIAAGVFIAAIGMVTCFVPGLLNPLPRLLLFCCFGLGGFFQFVRLLFAKNKLPAWIKYGGVFRHLVYGCAAVYILSILIALLIWQQRLLPVPLTALALLAYAAAVIGLACILRIIYNSYPEAETSGAGIPFDKAMLLLTGIFMLLLGILLIPVNLGLLPFSGSAQLGLLMVIFALQMLSSGNTPLGPFPRTWLMVLLGLLFALLGIVSCIIPEILVSPLTTLVGLLNILGGIIGLAKLGVSRRKETAADQTAKPPILQKLFATQVTLNLLSILFGTSMFVSQLIPGLLVGVILALNGGVLLYLIHILAIIDKLQSAAVNSVGA